VHPKAKKHNVCVETVDELECGKRKYLPHFAVFCIL
jgi:hypothetical protein